MVLDLMFRPNQFVPKVPHGGEEQGNSQLMAPDVRRLFFHFSHPDSIVPGIEVVESSGSMIKLIAENQY